jgi:SPW repeat
MTRKRAPGFELASSLLLSGVMTDWRLALVRMIPLRAGFTTDLVLGVVLIVSPFVFGFSGNGAATASRSSSAR